MPPKKRRRRRSLYGRLSAGRHAGGIIVAARTLQTQPRSAGNEGTKRRGTRWWLSSLTHRVAGNMPARFLGHGMEEAHHLARDHAIVAAAVGGGQPKGEEVSDRLPEEWNTWD